MCVTRDVTERVRVRHVDRNLTNLNIHERKEAETSSLEPRWGTHSDMKQKRVHYVH